MYNRQSSFRSLDRRSGEVGGRSYTGSDIKLTRRRTMGSDFNENLSHESDSQDEVDQILGPDPEAELARLQANASRSHVGKSVTSRLYHDGRRRAQLTQERLHLVREQVLMKEMAEMTQKPNITQRARTKPSKGILFAEHSQEWLAKKELRRQELEAELYAEKMKEVQQSPSIDKRSAQLVERLDDYSGPVSGWEAHFAKFCAKKTVPLPPQLFHPNINSNAIRLDVEEDIADRLFKDARSREQRKKDLVEYVRSEELIDHNTGRPLFTPQSLRGPLDSGESSARRRRPEEVAEELLAKGAEIEAKKKQQAQRRIDDTDLTFSPAINKRSAVLAEQAGRAPLYEPKSASRSRRGPSAGESASKPRGESSAAGGGKSPTYDVNEFVRRNEQAAIARQIRLEQIKQAAEEEKLRECSFQPKISKKSHEIFSSANVYGVDVRQPTEQDLQSEHHHSTAPQALRFSESASNGGRTPKQPRHMDAAAGVVDVSGSLTPRNGAAAAAAAPSDAASPAPLPQVDEYISTFERQMFAVLDEWRKLEDN